MLARLASSLTICLEFRGFVFLWLKSERAELALLSLYYWARITIPTKFVGILCADHNIIRHYQACKNMIDVFGLTEAPGLHYSKFNISSVLLWGLSVCLSVREQVLRSGTDKALSDAACLILGTVEGGLYRESREMICWDRWCLASLSYFIVFLLYSTDSRALMYPIRCCSQVG